MKCVCGPCDDEVFDPPPRMRLHDHVRIPEKYKPASVSFDPENIPSLTTSYHVYIIDCFNFSKDDRYYFLRHESLTDKQAMLHQFSKKCLKNY